MGAMGGSRICCVVGEPGITCVCMYGVCVHVCMSSHAKDMHELQTMSTLGLAPQRLLMRLARRVHPGDLSERTDRGRGLVLPI